MDALTREETLAVLFSMGIEIPSQTQLPNEALSKRLRQAINAAQCLDTLIPSGRVDPATLEAWPSEGDNRSVYEAIRRGNMYEAMANVNAHAIGRDQPLDLYVNAFMDLRQTLMAVTVSWHEGRTWGIMQDPEHEKCAINFRILSIHAVNEGVPLIVLMYHSFTAANPLPGVRWVQGQMAKTEGHGQVQNIKCTELEQKFLLRLLSLNAKHLPAEFQPQKEPTEQDFKVSFLLPVGPLTFEDLGKLNLDTGCVLCGKKTTSRCSQCQTVSYCGRDCQREDWPTHKQTCRSLKGGTWRTVPVTILPHPHAGTGGYMVSVNRFNSRSSPLERVKSVAERAPPPNVYGSRLFLVKMQIRLDANAANMMIYDRQRSFEVFFKQDLAPAVFSEFRAEMQGPRGGYHGMKMYRWAKREGDWELSVCLDRAPDTEIKW